MRKSTALIGSTAVAGAIVAGIVIVAVTDEQAQKPAVVTLTCNNKSNLYTVDFHKPADGSVFETRHFVLGKDMQTIAMCGSRIPGNGLRSAFNEEFTELAVRKQMSANGTHVGVISASDDPSKTGKFTDLSGDTKNFGAYVKQSKPAFGPDGKLYFMQAFNKDGVSLKSVKGHGKPEHVNGAPQLDDPNVNDAFYYLPGETKPQTDDTPFATYLNDGSWVFSTEADDSKLLYGKPGGKTYKVDLPHGKGTEGDFTIRMDPRIALNKKDFLGLSPTTDRLYVVHVNRELVDLADGLTYPGGRIIDPQLSPDGKNIVYVVKNAANKHTLLRVGIDGNKLGKANTLTSAKLGTSTSNDVRLLAVR